MKKNLKNKSVSSAVAPSVPVRLVFSHPTATKVCLAGTFNQWRPETVKLDSSACGEWLKELALPPGTYEYCFIVDGEWISDPLATDYAPNPFGGRNSVLTVPHAI